MSEQSFVIVGAGLAGARAAEELRAQGFDGQITLIGAESEPPYERPPLTKDYLRGESVRDKVHVHPADFYERQQIDLITATTVTGIDTGRRLISLDGGRELRYDRLLLSTGAEPRRLNVPGSELEGIHYLRTLQDCEALQDRLDTGGHAAVVGAGWIGSEFAASARQRGLDVTLIDPLRLPNERIFGAEIGEFYRDLHAAHGIKLLLGRGVEEFEGARSVRAVRTSDGRSIDCDFVVVGIGVIPCTGLARSAGAKVDNGIVVNQQLRTTVPGIFAAGDVANAWHPLFRREIRVEHWANALNQGPAAAQAMLDQPVSFERIPYFFSDQYETGMEYCGHAPQWDEVIFRGTPDSGEFIAFWLHDERVVAGMNVNIWDVSDHIQAMIRSRLPVTPAALRDPDVPLESLAGSPVG